MRVLLHSAMPLIGAGEGVEDDHDHEHDHDHAHEHDATKTLRIVGLFLILLAGLAGSVPPLLMKVGGCWLADREEGG